MPYDDADPRSQMAASAAVVGVPRAASYRELGTSGADEVSALGSTTWWTRSQAVVVGYTNAQAGDVLVSESDGESVMLALDGVQFTVSQASVVASVTEPSTVVVPAGASTIAVSASGTLVRLFAASLTPALASSCGNSYAYETADVNVAPFQTWPLPADGPRVHVYPWSRYPPEPGRLGSIFRCSTLMVNVFPVDDLPRDPRKLSPHHHDDFEQISLQVAGDYVHHMRRPWTPDSTTWVDDEHRICHAPAIVVIPPLLIHTSQSINEMPHFLIDIFAPPRLDFSNRPGWVLNADDYPMPPVS
jgi:hypothetical protein